MLIFSTLYECSPNPYLMKRKQLILIIGIIGLVVLLGKIFKSVTDKEIAEVTQDFLPNTHTLAPWDSGAISPASIAEIRSVEVYNSVRNKPISFLAFKTGQIVSAFSFKLTRNVSLRESVFTQLESETMSVGYDYRSFPDNPYLFIYLIMDSSRPASSLYFTISGDEINLVEKSDSILYYKLLLNNLSIRYGKDQRQEVFIEGREKYGLQERDIPAEVLFLKKDSMVYWMMATPDTAGVPFSGRFLYDILSKRNP